MKKNICNLNLRWFMYILITFVSAVTISCGSDEDNWERPDDMTAYVPDYSVSLLGSGSTYSTYWGVSGGTAKFDSRPYFRADFDYWQLQVVSISYYIDEKFAQTATEEPYSFVYTATGLTRGTHKLIGRTRIKDLTNGKEIIINPSMEFEVK